MSEGSACVGAHSLHHSRIFRHHQVLWRGALADAARGVVVRAVAGAKVAAEIASVGDGHAAQMRADANDDQPLWRLLFGC